MRKKSKWKKGRQPYDAKIILRLTASQKLKWQVHLSASRQMSAFIRKAVEEKILRETRLTEEATVGPANPGVYTS